MTTPRSIIIDSDPSPDDAIAIMVALAAPEKLEVLAVTTVAGNVPIELTSKNARKALELINRTDVKVYGGAAAPLTRPLVTAEVVHGKTGFDGYELPEPAMALTPGFAPDVIIDLIMSRPTATVTMCCLAPLTNLALAMIKEPKLAGHLKEIVLMGGAFSEGGNITPSAEFNIYVDPQAAHRVFTAGTPITMIPLDCTHLARTTKVRMQQLRDKKTHLAEVIYELMRFNKQFDEAKYKTDGGPLHDATVIAYLLKPELFDGRRVHVAIECASELTMGMTVVDWWGVTGKTPNATVLREIDADGYFNLVIESIARLSRR